MLFATEKTGDFDLFYTGINKTSIVIDPPNGGLSQFMMCFWVRFAEPGQEVTFITLSNSV